MKKLITLELDVTSVTDTFTPYSAGIYYRNMTVPASALSNSFMTTVFGCAVNPDFPNDPTTIGSMRIENSLVGKVGSVDELSQQDGSFFFDTASQLLYIALFDYETAAYYISYKVGETTGFLSEAQMQEINGCQYPINILLGSVSYDPRLDKDISAAEEVDDQSNGIFIFDSLSANIDNTDGKYDQIRDNITGNEARVLIADISSSPEEEIQTGFPYKIKADSSDFKVARLGIIEDVDYSNPNNPTINAIDRRADWSQTIGGRVLTTSEFPNLEDKYINKLVPLCYGVVTGVEAVQLSPNPGSPTNTTFIVCETEYGAISSVSGVYFDGRISGVDVDRYLTGGEYSINLSTGILTVNNFDRGKVWVDGVFIESLETVAGVLFFLEEFANLSYIPSNFNKNEIEQIRDLNYLTHVYIDTKGRKLYDVIEQLVMDIQVDFFQQGSILTMRKSNEERSAVEFVPNTQIFDNPAPWVNDRSDTVKTISVEYNRNYRDDTFETYYDATKEQTAIDNNRKAIDKTFETNLISQSDVIEIYDTYYSRFTAPSRTVTVNRTIPFKAGLTDFVTFKVARQVNGKEEKVFERALYKVISRDPVNNTVELAYFSDRAEPYLTGGVLAFADLAYQAPDGADIIFTYQGGLAFADLAYMDIASITGTIVIPASISDSGILASIPQQIGE